VWAYTWNVPSGNDGPVAVSVSASDRAGNPNTAATGQTGYTIDNTDPLFAATDPLVMAGDDSYAAVTFSEDVYGDSAHSTAIVDSDLDLDMGTGSTGVIDSWTISPAHTPGSDTLRIAITWNTDPVTGDEVILSVNGSNRIYDTAGNDMPSSTSGSGNAKSLSLNLPYTVRVTVVQNEPKQSSPVTSSKRSPAYRPPTIIKSEVSQDREIALLESSPAIPYPGKQNTQSVSKTKPVDPSEFTLFSLETEPVSISQGDTSTDIEFKRSTPNASRDEREMTSAVIPVNPLVENPQAVQDEESIGTDGSAAEAPITDLARADSAKQRLPLFPLGIVALITILGTAAFWVGSRFFDTVGNRDDRQSL
jgi:hypothetical protein